MSGYPYGLRNAPAVGGGLPGLPQRASTSFNEVLNIASFQLPAVNTTADFEIPFRFDSPAELDLIVRRSAFDPGASLLTVLSASPFGLEANFVPAQSTTNSVRVFLVGNAIRIVNSGYTAFSGRFEILRRNRRVRQAARLTVASVESQLPFAIVNPTKAMLTSTLGPAGMQSAAMINNYYSAADVGAWHVYGGPANLSASAKITSQSTYLTNDNGSISSAFVLTEFF